MFYMFVGAILPNINSFSPCARVAIVLVEQLAQFLCSIGPISTIDPVFIRPHASVAHHSPQSWRRTFRPNFEQRSSSVTLIMWNRVQCQEHLLQPPRRCQRDAAIRPSPPVKTIIGNADSLPYRPRYRSPRWDLLTLLLSSINFTVLLIKMLTKIILHVFHCRGELTLFRC